MFVALTWTCYIYNLNNRSGDVCIMTQNCPTEHTCQYGGVLCLFNDNQGSTVRIQFRLFVSSHVYSFDKNYTKAVSHADCNLWPSSTVLLKALLSYWLRVRVRTWVCVRTFICACVRVYVCMYALVCVLSFCTWMY